MHNQKFRRGSTYISLAIFLPVVVGFTAAGVDVGAIYIAKHQVQMAADEGAMAAVTAMEDPEVAQYRADAYAAELRLNGLEASIESMDWGYWSKESKVWQFPTAEEPNAVKVTAVVEVPTPFLAIFGLPSVTVRSSAGAAPNVVPVRTPDLVIVLDVTTSMSASELADERAAALALVECINENSTDDSRAAIVSFTGLDKTLMGMSDYGSAYDTMQSELEGLDGCGTGSGPRCGSTNQAAGLAGARYILENAETPEGIGQAVILLSDGSPTSKDEGSSDSFDGDSSKSTPGTCNYFYDNDGSTYAFKGTTGAHFDFATRCAETPGVAKWNQTCTGSGSKKKCTNTTVKTWKNMDGDDVKDWAMDERDLLMAQDVDIYTVYYSNDDAGGTAFMRDLASDPEMALETPDSDEIYDAFQDICVAYADGGAGLVF